MKRIAFLTGIGIAVLITAALVSYAGFVCASYLFSGKDAQTGIEVKTAAFLNIQKQVRSYVKDTGVGEFRCKSNGESFSIDAAMVIYQPDLRKALDAALAAGVCQAFLVPNERSSTTASLLRSTHEMEKIVR